MRIAIGSAAVLLVLSAALAGCSGDDPEVCQSVDDLESSVTDARDVDVTADNAIDELTTALDAVKSDLDAVKSEAKAEFADQIDSVESAYSTLETSASAAAAAPSADTLSTAGADLSAFGTAVQTLIEDVQATC